MVIKWLIWARPLFAIIALIFKITIVNDLYDGTLSRHYYVEGD